MKKSEAEAIAKREFGEDAYCKRHEGCDGKTVCAVVRNEETGHHHVKEHYYVFGDGSSWEVALKRARQNFDTESEE